MSKCSTAQTLCILQAADWPWAQRDCKCEPLVHYKCLALYAFAAAFGALGCPAVADMLRQHPSATSIVPSNAAGVTATCGVASDATHFTALLSETLVYSFNPT